MGDHHCGQFETLLPYSGLRNGKEQASKKGNEKLRHTDLAERDSKKKNRTHGLLIMSVATRKRYNAEPKKAGSSKQRSFSGEK